RVAIELIASRQSVVLADLVVKTAADIRSRARVRNAFAELKRIQAGIECRCVYDSDLVDIAPLKVDEERCFLAQRSADIGHVLFGVVVGSLIGREKWVAGIER